MGVCMATHTGLMKTLKVSPDAYIQQALQLAYARGNNGQV